MAEPSAAAIDPAQAFDGAAWCDVVSRSEALPRLPATLLLHAGPPFQDTPPAPVKNAAVQAILFERMAANDGDAEQLLSSGRIRLAPAQDYGIATPLAQVVSASMWLIAVRQGAHLGFAAMLEGAAPALRFGSKDPACRERLGLLGRLLTDRLRTVLQTSPLPLASIIRTAVAAGEDCHSRTTVANQSLLRCLTESAGAALDTQVTTVLTTMPAFVLPVLMAAAVAALRRHDCPVETLGGNGVDFGLRRRGAAVWDRLPAVAPTGTRFAGWHECVALPAIGDSVLVDFCGLGGQVDDTTSRDALRDPDSGILDYARIAAAPATAPTFNLAILDAAGIAGLIGRGVYRAPAALFPTPHRGRR